MNVGPDNSVIAEPEISQRPFLVRPLGRALARRFLAAGDGVPSRSDHWAWLAISLVFVLMPAVFSFDPVDPSARLLGVRLPPLCWSEAFFGVRCPGCGLTRAFILVAHGRLTESLAFHRVGIALYAWFAGQVGLRAWALWRRRWPDGLRHAMNVCAYAFVAALFANWIAGFWLGSN